MEKQRLYGVLSFSLLSSVICVNASFTEVPRDVSVAEGEDVEMPCAFRAAGAAPMALEIQWWYLREVDAQEDLGHELQIGAPVGKDQISPNEGTKISTVRVQGNAISHRLSLARVRPQDGGVYECRVSDLWAADAQEFSVRATMHVAPRDAMLAEEAVSHIQNRWLLRDGHAPPAPGHAPPPPSTPPPGRAGDGRRAPGPPSSSSAPSWAGKATVAPPGNRAIRQHQAGGGVMSTSDPLLFTCLLVLQNILLPLLAT